MEIRRLTADDARAFQDLRLDALQESPASFSSSFEEEHDRSLSQVAQFLSGSLERVVLGAFTEAGLSGVVGVGREWAVKQRHIGFIRSMYVSVQCRRQHLGTALISEAIAVAAAWPGLKQLTLIVNANNASAIALYLRSGFVQFGCHPRALYVGGTYHDELHMVRHSAA